MLSIIASFLSGAAAFVAGAHFFGWGSGVFLGLVALIVPYILIFRRINRLVQGHMKEVERLVGAQQPERAIEKLNGMRPLGRWQILLGSTIDAQIGMLRYAHLRDFDGAEPYLKRASGMAWQAKLMLAAHHFRRKRYDEMVRVFERAVRRARKEGMAWLAYAWCEWKRGQLKSALHVLARGREKLPSDERMARMQEALQNGGKPKTRSFGPEWVALFLEDVPAQSARPQRLPSLPPHLLRRAGVRVRTR
jgi:tetratricopeptide (TPR) repeat protein